jgi:RHS repeat-associated protein
MQVFKRFLVVGLVTFVWMAFVTPDSARAEDRVFTLQGTNVVLQEVSASTEVYFQSMRLNRALNEWAFELKVRNTAVATLVGPVVVVFESVTNATGPLAPDGIDTAGKPWFDLSAKLPVPGLATGLESGLRTLALGVAAGTPKLGVRVFASAAVSGVALALANAVDDIGHPLAGVQIAETGPEGSGNVVTDSESGSATVGRGAGTNLFVFSASDYLPVWRKTVLANGSVLVVPTPRLTPRDTNSFQYSSAPTVFSNRLGTMRIIATAAAFAGAGQGRLTTLTPQTLPAMLPAGWSPLQAFWLELTREPVLPLTGKLFLSDILRLDETAALVRWDSGTVEWNVVQLIPGTGAAVIDVPLAASGAYAVVVADKGVGAPPAPVLGKALRGITSLVLDYAYLTARGTLVPSSSPASRIPELVTSQAQLIVSNAAGGLPSGTLFRGEVSECYHLQDGNDWVLPTHQVYVVGYQRPGDTEAKTLEANFPMRPQLLLGAEELLLGSIKLAVLPPTDFLGGVLKTNGLAVTNGDLRLNIPAGVVNRAQAVQLDLLDTASFGGLLADGFSAVAAFQLRATGLGEQLMTFQMDGLSPNSFFVLARVRSEKNIYGLEPVERLVTDASSRMTSAEPVTGPRLSGLNTAGQFVLVQVNTAPSLLSGIARNAAGQAVAGLLVRRDPWLTFSGSGGVFQLLSSPGVVQLRVVDLASGDLGLLNVTTPTNGVLNGLNAIVINEGPRVLAVNPTNGAFNVSRVAAVEVTFSKPINPIAVLNGGIQLLGLSNQPVVAAVSLNLANTVATLLSSEPLFPNMLHTLLLATNIADLSGRKLAGPNAFSFRTFSEVFDRTGAKLTSYEPVNGVSGMVGGPGAAEPDAPVILVNETTGRTSTVRAQPDGSFSNSIPAEVDDRLSAVFVNANGTRNQIRVSRQKFLDGSEALFDGGGTIDVAGEHGPIQFIVEAGAIPGKTKFKFESVPLNVVTQMLKGVQPADGGKILGGIKMSAIQGSPVTKMIDVKFPVDPNNLGLPPGVNPTNCGFGLAIARVVGGEQVYELIDRMQYEDGQLVTHSPPFFGLLGPYEELFLLPFLMVVNNTPTIVTGRVYATDNATTNYLGGALVTGKANSDGLVLGRLRPGAVYTVTSSEPGANAGKYTLMVNSVAGSAGFINTLSATHPFFPFQKGILEMPQLNNSQKLTIGNVFTKMDILFAVPPGGVNFPPAISASHTPTFPSTNMGCILTVAATDNTSTPDISLDIDSVRALIPGQFASLNDVVVTLDSDSPTATSRQQSYHITTYRALSATFKIRAVDSQGNPVEQLYPIAFGSVAQSPAVNPPVADTNDHTGPLVVYMSPAPGSTGLAPGQPLTIQFNEPVRRESLFAPSVFVLSPPGGTPEIVLSADQREVKLFYPQIKSGLSYSFVMGTFVQDLNDNFLDQDPVALGAQPFTAEFKSATTRNFNFPAQPADRGVVGSYIQGNYAYVLDRSAASAVTATSAGLPLGTELGRLAIYGLTDPALPTLEGEYFMPPFPRELVRIPNYAYLFFATNDVNGIPQKAFQTTTGGSYANGLTIPLPRAPHYNEITNRFTNDLVAVVGGLAGAGENQWLRVLDVSDPTHPRRLAGTLISTAGSYLPGRLRWSPPVLAYMESGDHDRISIVNLQALLMMELLSQDKQLYLELPMNGYEGLDLNQDGDYADAGEISPLPERHPSEFGGKINTVTIPDTSQPIRDFVIENGGFFVGAIVGPGVKVDNGGIPLVPTQPTPAGYRTLFNSGLNLTVDNSQFTITNGSPRRIFALMGQEITTTNGSAFRDLVCITVNGVSTNDYLLVLDVTDPLTPTEIITLPLPPGTTGENVNSILQRADGLLAVAGDGVTFLIDPGLFQKPFRADGSHPAILGTITGVGGFVRNFSSTIHGYHLSADDNARATLAQTPPRFSFVQFPTNTPFGFRMLTNVLWYAPTNLTRLSPSNINPTIPTNLWGFVAPVEFSPQRDLSFRVLTNLTVAERAATIAGARIVDFLEPSFLHQPGRCQTISQVLSWNDYHLLVNAPGGAGETIELGLESLDWAGQALRKKGLLFPPVHALGAAALNTIGQTPDSDDAPVRSLKARRMSDDPNSDDYNRYISRPFWLVVEALEQQELTNLTYRMDRDILWSGHSLRASIDSSMVTNAALGAYAAQADIFEKVIKAGAEITAQCFPGDSIPSPNPGPINGEMLLPTLLYAVSAHNGELVMKSTDLVLPGRKMPTSFARTFRGQAIHDGPFGRGWDFNFNQRVIEVRACLAITPRDDPQEYEGADPGDLIFHPGGAPPIVFKFAGNTPPTEIAADPLIQHLGWIPRAAGYYLPPQGMFSPMIKFKDGRFVRLDPDGKQTWFNPAGRLDRVYDRYEKNFQELVYNSRGQLIRIYDDMHRPIDLGYYRNGLDPLFRAGYDLTPVQPNDIGKVCRLKDYSGRDVLYFYTSDGLLDRFKGVEVVTGPVNSFKGRQETKYRYSDGSDLKKSAKSLIGVDGADRGGVPLLSVTGHSSQGRDVVGKFNFMGHETAIAQTHRNIATELAKAGSSNIVHSPDASWSQTGFDAVGRPTESIIGGDNGQTQTNRQEYFGAGAARGAVRSTTSAYGDRTEFTYDIANPSLRSRGNLVSMKKIPGTRGGPVLENSTEYDGWYNLPSGLKKDFNRVAATIVLTPDHRSVERVTRAGERELYTYNEYGQVKSHTGMDDISTFITYVDGFVSSRQIGNQPPTTFSYAPISAAASDPGARGKPSSVTDPSGVITRFLHDELDRIVAEEREGAVSSQAYDKMGNIVERITQVETNRVVVQDNHYLSHGFMDEQTVLGVETENGITDIVTKFYPDSLNRIKQMITPSGEQHFYIYDHLGKLVEEQIPGLQTNSMTYDLSGNVVKIQKGDAVEQFFYDGHERLIQIVGANGATNRFFLDKNGNALTNRIFDPSGVLMQESWSVYDELNRLRIRGVTRDDGTITAKYDFFSAGRKMTATDALGQTIDTYLDPIGRVSKVVMPYKTREMDYDLASNLQAERLIEAGVTYETKYAYNTRRQLVSVTNNLGFSQNFTVEVDGRMIRDTDREGHITTNVFTLLGELAAQLRPEGVTQTNQYDVARNITSVADHAGNVMRYQFDANNHNVTNFLANGKYETYENFNIFGLPQTQHLPRDITVTSGFDFEGKLTNRIVSGLGAATQDTYEYDGLRRYSRIIDSSGTTEFHYDLGGYLRDLVRVNVFKTQPVAVVAVSNSVSIRADAAGFRTNLTYPASGLNVAFKRDVTGRINSFGPVSAEAVATNIAWAGDSRMTELVLGAGKIKLELFYDNEPRMTVKRYTRLSDGAVLADMRYAFDRDGLTVVKQQVHRGGLTDFYQYDSDHRLLRADTASRPGITSFSNSIGFQAVGLGGDWRAGSYAREARYAKIDLLTNLTTHDPFGLVLTPMPTNFSAPDAFVCVTNLDGFARQVDDVGNVTRAKLVVRLPGVVQPELVAATLNYNALGQLERIDRDDGVTIYNEYDSFNLRLRRAITGPAGRCVPSDIAYLYNDGLLLEERDLSAGAALLRRYYYSDESDEPLAADIRATPADNFRRVYFLSDRLHSVISVTDQDGFELERRNYDAWGQPVFELPDTEVPQLSRVTQVTNGLVLVFSEPILPVLATLPNPSNGPITSLPVLAAGMRVRSGTTNVSGVFVFDDRDASGGYGSAIRFIPDQPMTGTKVLEVDAGFLRDEWDNRNPIASISLNAGQSAGTILFSGISPGSSRGPLVSRSATGVSFGFHGQYFDEETGLLYCRERYYDTFTGSFLQRDPKGYADSVNQYAGFANNPVNFRDPTGSSIASDMRAMGETLQEDAQKNRESHSLLNDYKANCQDGLSGVLSLPADAAAAWDVVDSPSEGGSLDLLKRLEAADTLLSVHGRVRSVISKAGGYYKNLRTVSGFLARRMEGMQARMQERSRNSQLRRDTHSFLVKQGMTSWEAEGLINFQAQLKAKYGYDSVEVAIRGFGEKADARRSNREKGISTKPGWAGDRTGSDGASHVQIEHGNLKVNRQFTGDLDMYYVKVNGKTLSGPEVEALKIPMNKAIGEAYKRQGGKGTIGSSIHHGAHVNMLEVYGEKVKNYSAGMQKHEGPKFPGDRLNVYQNQMNPNKAATYDNMSMGGFTGAGAEAFAVRCEGIGRVTGYEPGVSMLKAEIDQSAHQFWQRTGMHVDDIGGNMDWYRNFPK